MNEFSSNKIPFGLNKRENRLVDVTNVLSGLKCGVVCPSCEGALQANKGTSGKRQHYFSHDPSSNTAECRSAFETSVHLMAKQILADYKSTIMPDLSLTMIIKDDSGTNHSDSINVIEKSEQVFRDVVLEQRLGEIRPDIIAYTKSSKPILIEIAVTNFTGTEKKAKIREMGLDAIEVDLSKISYSITEDELKPLVIEQFKNKKWLSNPLAIQAKLELSARLNRTVSEHNEKIASIAADRAKRTLFSIPSQKQSNQHTPPEYKPYIHKEYDPRWFLCEACRYLFSKPLKESPYSLKTIECPECSFDVSTDPAK